MWVVLFSGKFETPDHRKFMEGLQQLVKDTDTKIFGDFKFQEFIEFEPVEDGEVEIIDNNAEKENNRDSDISGRS